MKEGILETSSENNYDFLEPWIQWPSVHTGYEFSEHKIFRLGDIVKSDFPQIFEKIENKGFSVGAISPMNARNDLINPTISFLILGRIQKAIDRSSVDS